MTPKSPWYWKLAGLVLIATGLFLGFLPLLLAKATFVIFVVFAISGIVFAGIGVLFLRTTPAPQTFFCTACKLETPKSQYAFFCPGCGRAMEESEDELRPSEILCPYCDAVIEKKPGACRSCSRQLPGFGIETAKGETVCRWCKSRVNADEKFCKFCSAPLAVRFAQQLR